MSAQINNVVQKKLEKKQSSKLTEKEKITKKALTPQKIGGVRTNIAITKTQKEYYQKFVNLSVNDQPLPQGDGTIKISPFDDYFLFTIYNEIDGEDTPIDLSNVGNIYINFIGTYDEINIENHTQVEEADLSQGEALFRITRSDSKKILALDNNNFYISTQMIDETDGSISDESVVYQGIWLAFDDASRITLTSQIEEQRLEYSIELAILKENNVALEEHIVKLKTMINQDNISTQALQASNDEMVNEIAELSKDVTSTKITEINRRAKEATALRNEAIRSRQQNTALTNAKSGGSSQKANYIAAAKNLQQYSTGVNAVSQR